MTKQKIDKLKLEIDKLKLAFYLQAERAKKISRKNGHDNKFDKAIMDATKKGFNGILTMIKS